MTPPQQPSPSSLSGNWRGLSAKGMAKFLAELRKIKAPATHPQEKPLDQETHDKLDRCRADPVHFISQYVKTYDATAKDWIRLDLWPAQQEIVVSLESAMLSIMLKARQLGCTTVVLAYVLWVMLFRPIATVLLFSRRDDEAVDLLDFRLKGMHRRLPPWMRSDPFNEDNDHEWQLANGSRALAFGRVGGDSYTATIAVIDEADLIPELAKLMQSVKPTIDAGGKLVLLSRQEQAGKPLQENLPGRL